MNDVHIVSNKLIFILYADDTTLISLRHLFLYPPPPPSRTVNELSLNAAKTKLMLFHNYQKYIYPSPHFMINDTIIELVTE